MDRAPASEAGSGGSIPLEGARYLWLETIHNHVWFSYNNLLDKSNWCCMVETYERLIYQQKKALKAWMAAVGTLTTPDIEPLVWELMLLCIENLTEPSSDIDEEISKAAHELAGAVLEGSDVKTLYLNYRDRLMDSILANLASEQRYMAKMIHFSNLLSDAYGEAYADRLRRLISQQRASRLSEELTLAKRIQERLLPKTIPSIPGFQVAGKVIPAREIGGDYWSVKYHSEDGIVTIKLADITGHGIAAATLVAAVKFISGGYYRGAASAKEVMEQTNSILVKETPADVLVTMVYGWLYPDQKEIDIVNAGHEPVFICSDHLCTDIIPTGPILGVSEAEYGQIRIKMKTDDILFFCSDGITEAGTAEPFGTNRVKEVVMANRDNTADEIADAVIQAAVDYAGQPHDDMSIVVVKAVA